MSLFLTIIWLIIRVLSLYLSYWVKSFFEEGSNQPQKIVEGGECEHKGMKCQKFIFCVFFGLGS